MDSYPNSPNLTEDSGFVGSIDLADGSMAAVMPITGSKPVFQESTPHAHHIHPNITSRRKRKFATMISHEHDAEGPKISTPIPIDYHSSTCNESLITKSLENCNISSFFPNVDKLCTPPTTPVKADPDADDDETSFFRAHREGLQRTPVRVPSTQKLGSPEHKEIIYGRDYVSYRQRVSPAKKKLFESSFPAPRRKTYVSDKLDPVMFFTRRHSLPHVVHKIFMLLTPAELYQAKQVCHDWNWVVTNDKEFNQLAEGYRQGRLMEKENGSERRMFEAPPSPEKLDEALSCSFYKTGKTLKDGQYLAHCPRCGRESIVDNGIGQCQALLCNYIYCLRCGSCSTTGPDDFRDRCMSSSLVYEKPRRRQSLLDSPEKPTRLSFFEHESASNSKRHSTPSPVLATPPAPRRYSMNGSRRSFLSSHNAKVPETKANSPKRNFYVPVIPMKSTPRSQRGGSSSPPASPVKGYSAGTKASKKNLKRLARLN